MERCKHDFSIDQCAECRASDRLPSRVAVTSAGNVFHKRQDCRALLEGQALARARGYDPADPRTIPLTDALARGLGECLVCFHGADPWYWRERLTARDNAGSPF